jgi:hypothetical protein
MEEIVPTRFNSHQRLFVFIDVSEFLDALRIDVFLCVTEFVYSLIDLFAAWMVFEMLLQLGVDHERSFAVIDDSEIESLIFVAEAADAIFDLRPI